MNGKVTVDQLAQVIRTVDGGHSLGAAALAEAILEAVPNLQPAKPEAVRLRDDLLERAEFEAWCTSQRFPMSTQRMPTDGNEYRSLKAREAWRVWQAALAAAGKKQAAVPQFHHVKKVVEHFNMAVTPQQMAEAIAGAPDSLFSMEAAHKAFAGAGKQQVGEVQGDGLDQLAQAAYKALQATGHLCGGDPFDNATEDDKDAMRRVAAAVLAARQPVGQEQSHWGWLIAGVPFPGAGCCDKSAVPLYAGFPPAQAVDLGQFRVQVAELLRSEFDLEVADPEDHRHDDGQGEAERLAARIAALIDGQTVQS